MAFYTVEKRVRNDGTPRFRCTVAIKEKGVYIHRESETFPKLTIAKAWGAKRVAELEANGIPKEGAKTTLADLINKYLSDPDIKKGGDKIRRLQRFAADQLGAMQLSDIKTMHYIEYGRKRSALGRSPGTILAEISYLRTVLEAATPFWGIEVHIDEFDAAKIYMAKMGITGAGKKRDRRAEGDEIKILMAELARRRSVSRDKIPYDTIFEFAIYSCMRVGEICRILWADVDEKTQSVLVRDRKDPKKKIGNHQVVPLLGRAWEIVQAQPKHDERIFPYHAKTMSVLFIKAKNTVGITGLRFHDMRREAASRLFELGFSIEEVAQVTGHKNLNTLWTVYRKMFPQTLHDRFAQLQRERAKGD